jgi:thiol:disulfide interchange protein DsbC
MKYISILGAAVMAFSGSSFAANSVDDAIAQLKANERIANFEVTHDEEISAILKEKFDFSGEVIKVAGNRMGLLPDSGIVFQLGAAFTSDGLQPLQSAVTNIIMSKPESQDWYPLPMAEGSEVKATAYVFTDPTCGYCSKLHKEKAQHDAAGIQVVAIPWPRYGVESDNQGYNLWVNAVCSENPGKAYNDLVMDNVMPVFDPSKDIESCKKTVAKAFNLGKEVGVSGTPYIYAISNEGQVFTAAGYVPTDQMAAALKI